MMRLVRLIGDVLLVAGLVGLLTSLPAPIQDIAIPLDLPLKADSEVAGATGLADQPASPITAIRAPAIRLDSEVIPARLAEVHGALTWEVPPFRVGHAEGTAGAGQRGNAVLMGHVVSRTLGNVFQHLDELQPGDQVSLFSDSQEFVYVVTDVRVVSPTDMTVVQPTKIGSATLITCTGVWLPSLQDYSQRLIVRAELPGD